MTTAHARPKIGPRPPQTDAQVRADIRDHLASIQNCLELAVFDPTKPQGLIRRITVAAADNPVSGPDVQLPNRSIDTVVRMRRHSGSPDGYVAFTKEQALDDNYRSVLRDNDAIRVRVSNWNKIWFNASIANTNFELIIELF